MIMDWYKSRDYNFVGLSDHNILADHEKWVRVTKSKLYEDACENYLQKYGEDWVKYKIDSGRSEVLLKTYEQYKPLFEDENFLIIQSEEITDRFGDKPIHMNVTNVKQLIDPQGGESVADVMQRNVNAVLKQRNETGVPMFPHINHPNFFFGVSMEDIMQLKGERFFEVYNGHPMVYNYGDSTHPGTEQMWDIINIDYAIGGYFLAKISQHENTAQNQCRRVGNSLAGYIRGSAVNRFEHRHAVADVGAGRHP
jgi:hypothetical protein